MLKPTTPHDNEQALQDLVARRRGDYGDDQFVPDVTVGWLYSPHAISAVCAVVGFFLYLAWNTDSESSNMVSNLRTALVAIAFFVIVLGMMVFPTGPFIRPHPALWRAVFAVAVLYEVFLIIMLFQSKHDGRQLLKFIDPVLGVKPAEQSYGAHCEFTYSNIYDACDKFIMAHFIGWFLKALVIRDATILWVASISWEIVEMLFKHMLPNFNECWWDQWILDVLLCNGLGIFLGCKLCRKLEVMSYNWKSVYEFPTYGGKLKRVAMQFLPESWINVRWRKTASLKRFFGVHVVVVLISLQELNSFFLKTLLWVPASHYLNIVRLGFWFLFSVPCLRQIYLYMADPTVKSIGRQTFLSAIVLLTELLIIIKYSSGEFSEPMGESEWILLWVMVAAYIAFCIWGVYYILVEQPDQDPHKAVDEQLNKILVNLSASAEQLQQEAADATAAAVAESASKSNVDEEVVVSPPRRPARKPHSPAVAVTRSRSMSRKTVSPAVETASETVVTRRRTASAARKAPAATRAVSPARTRKSSRARKAAP